MLRMNLVVLHFIGLGLWEELAPLNLRSDNLKKAASRKHLARALRGWGFV